MAQDKYFRLEQGAVKIPCILNNTIATSYVWCDVATDGDIENVEATSAGGFGILEEAGTAGEERTVCVSGPTFGRLDGTGAAINAGVAVKATTGGYVVEASTTDPIVGYTLAPASGAYALIPIVLVGFGQLKMI